MTETTTAPAERIPRRTWIGLVALLVYVAVAGGLGNLLDEWFQPSDAAAELILTHVPVLVLIAAGLVFVAKAGWSSAVWRTPAAAFELRPRRRWLLVIPVLMLVQSASVLVTAPWGAWTLPSLLIAVLVFGAVGFGEELYFRGILRAAVSAHHGETVTLLVTSLGFGLAHALGSLAKGLPIGFIAFQVLVTAVSGAALYGVVLGTGRLWVAIALHALTDLSLTIGSGSLAETPSAGVDPGPVAIAAQGLQWVLAGFVLVSCIRRDLRVRRAAPDPGEPG